MYKENLIEAYHDPATILFRGIELKLLKQKFCKYLNKEKILDFGCGAGTACAAVFNHQISYGLDSNLHAVSLARKSKNYKKVFLTDSPKIPLKNNSMDLVFVNCVFEHVKRLEQTLTEINRVLKNNGLLIFTVPTDKFNRYGIFSFLRLHPLAKLYGWLRNKKYQHYHCYSLTTWTSLLKKYGFRVNDHFYYINKEEAELWDFLLFIRWPYRQLLRKIIHRKIINARMADDRAAAIAIAAQKNA